MKTGILQPKGFVSISLSDLCHRSVLYGLLWCYIYIYTGFNVMHSSVPYILYAAYAYASFPSMVGVARHVLFSRFTGSSSSLLVPVSEALRWPTVDPTASSSQWPQSRDRWASHGSFTRNSLGVFEWACLLNSHCKRA